MVTRDAESVIDEIRKYRQKIPIILSPEDFDPDSLLRGLEICVNEFKGKLIPERKLWRTLVKIEDINETHVYLLIPAWNPNKIILVNRNIITLHISDRLSSDMRLFAKVNIGASPASELYFSDWRDKIKRYD